MASEYVPDICVDYCEAVRCDGCKYEHATQQEREEAMKELEDK